MKKNENNKFKRQLVSGGIYIALAAAVVTVTLNGVKNIVGNEEDYDIPEINMEIPEIKIDESDLSVKDELKLMPDQIFSEEVTGVKEGVTSDILEENTDVNGQGTAYEELTSEKNTTEDFSVNSTESPVYESAQDSDIEVYDYYIKPADGYVDKVFSMNELLYSPTMGDFRTHNGIDITGDPGSGVRAVNNGIIKDIYYDEFYGNTIVIDHGNEMIAYYMNLTDTFPSDIAVGEYVESGQTIGGIGKSAVSECADVSHLHFSVMVNGEFVDPSEILNVK